MEKALLIVSFGTSVPGAEAAIENVEDALKNACPDREAYRAFTSRIICWNRSPPLAARTWSSSPPI